MYSCYATTTYSLYSNARLVTSPTRKAVAAVNPARLVPLPPQPVQLPAPNVLLQLTPSMKRVRAAQTARTVRIVIN